jgi:HD-GYP domain-containing protein (c-di-GMP phosphodiesterase class II)
MVKDPSGFSNTLTDIMFPLKKDLRAFNFMHLVDVFEKSNMMQHSTISSSILGYIGFPEDYVQAVKYHHAVRDEIPESPEIANLACVLHTADIMSLAYRKHSIDGKAAAIEALYTVLQSDEFPRESRRIAKEIIEDHFEIYYCTDSSTHLDEYFGTWYPDLETFIKLIKFLSFIQDYRSPFTRNHSFSIATLAQAIGRESFTERDSLELYLSGLIHDFGKITIPLEILHKPGGLTKYEELVMNSHIVETLKMIEPILDFKEIIFSAVAHHERLDGSGYPFKLKAPDLPLRARILQTCDVYVALVEERPYRPALPSKDAIAIIDQEVKERRLDGGVIEILNRLVKNGYETGKYSDLLSIFFEHDRELNFKGA